MPTIARIRFVNVVYENRQKRYNDEIFNFDGHNGAILLENGGGKTVLIQTLLQAVIPHLSLAGRKIKDTLVLSQSPAHIAVEWILQEHPRVYGLTAVTLFLKNEELHSYKYTYRYTPGDKQSIDQVPFTVFDAVGRKRPATAEEMHDYYLRMNGQSVNAHLFTDIFEYTNYLEKDFKLIHDEWASLATINTGEGDVAKFFEACKTTNDLVKKLLIPTILLANRHGDEVSFTKMFEEKRINLRKSKQIRQQIQENQGVEREVGKIMRVYEAQHRQLSSHFTLQQQGKSFYIAAQKNQQELMDQLRELEVRQGSLRAEEKGLNEQMESLVIADLHAEELVALTDYQAKNRKYKDSDEQLIVLEQEKHLLEYLRTKQDRDSKAAQLYEEKESLEAQKSQQQDSDLEAELQIIHGQLRGVYDGKEQLHRQALLDLESEQTLVKRDMQELQKTIDREDGLRQELEQQQVRHQTRIEYLKAEQDKIALQLLANVKEQQIGTEIIKWKKEAEYIQQSLAENMVLQNIKAQEKEVSSQQVTVYMKQEADIRLQLEKIASRLDENQRKHRSVLSTLHTIPGLRTIDSIYIDQGRVQAALGIMQDRLTKELAVARAQERRDFKLVDAYAAQDKFTFDPHIVSFLQNCNCVVESGTTYAERLIASGYGTQEELLAKYPLWAMSLVVQESDKKEVESKLSRSRGGLTSPVFIMTTTEARAAAAGTYQYTAIWPDFWPKVLEEKSFTEWKNLFMEQAQESQLLRETKESAWQELDVLYRNLDDFLLAYPQAEYEQYQQDKLALQDQWTLLKGSITAERQAEQAASKALESCLQAIGELNGQESALHSRLEKADDWQQKERTRLAEELTLVQCQQQLTAVINQLQVWKQSQELMAAKQEQLTYKIDVRKGALSLLVGEELYKQLQKFEPIPAIFSEDALNSKRLRLQEELAHLNLSIGVIQNRINTYQKEWEKFDRRLAEFDMEVPADRVFPTDGDIKLKHLQIEINHLQPEVQKNSQGVAEARRLYDSIHARREVHEKIYNEKFNTQVHVFTEELSIVRKRLSARHPEVAAELAVVGKNCDHVKQQVTDWENLCTQMKTSNGKLEFLGENIPSLPLSGEDINSFPYESQLMIDRLLKALELSHNQLIQGKSIVEKAKNVFENFCQHSNISNERMRQSILNGIRQKHEYQQMVAWEQDLKQQIQAANRVAEQNMQAYNEDIKHFINQLHLHLTSICDEMAVIQKMTGVKIEEQYKCIYEIKTPVWEEASAKEKLLGHLEWMTEKLATDGYKQEDGVEDHKKIRKDIDQWLSPSYLFTRISPNKSFTVGVRKVSNDNCISNYPKDWVTSNSWSGGEKWSKNMALFLGIQSYLAEKRQPMRHSQNNTRTVVLDNPFGQASSDHVLEPIFFIAKKLGFQIIALTALAEGKFLRDYFPIIYSCRLRRAVGGETSVMDKDLHINHAFFQDNAPQTLARIGQVTQIQLLS